MRGHDDSSGGLSIVQRAYRAEGMHRLVPWPVAATAMTVWANLVWHRSAQVRSDVIRHMEFLMPAGSTRTEIEAAARRYVVENYFRVERWHRPWQTTGHAPDGLGALHAAVDSRRGAIVNFMHFGETHAPLGAIARAGIPLSTALHESLLQPDRDSLQTQIVRTLTVSPTGRVFAARGSSEHVRWLLRAGEAVAIASDVPHDSFVQLLDRRVGVSLGAARLAKECDAPVFPLVATAVGRYPAWKLDTPIDPADHEDAMSLLQEMMRRHEEPLRRWPQALDHPLRRWTPEPAVAAEFDWDLTRPLAM